MVDYEGASARELQEECARRGLASARAAKAVMVQRLLDDDAHHEADGDTPEEPESAGDSGSGTEQPPATPIAVGPAAVGAFRMDFPAEPGGPDEETHLAYRQATVQAATDAGWTPRDGARLAATVDGRWVYEVAVRRTP